jgi:Ca-activated chloride channel family protein
VYVTGHVLGARAALHVEQHYRNDEAHAVEAIYTFPLPTQAVLTGFRMVVSDRVFEGLVKEREEAFQAYDESLSQGHGAALLEQERPNVFTLSVGNLLPGEDVSVVVDWVQCVFANEGAVRIVIPTPGRRAMCLAILRDRTAHGRVPPTDRVADADRISPPTGDASYRLELGIGSDLGQTCWWRVPRTPFTWSRSTSMFT